MVRILTTYWLDIVVVIAAIVTLLLLYKGGKKEIVRKIVLASVVSAEKALGRGTGELKYALVIDTIYKRLPLVLRLIFSEKAIDEFIEDSVTRLNELLTKGVDLNEYDPTQYS